MYRILLSLFLTGLFFGYGPCLVSCGPLLISYITGTQENSVGGLKVYLLFSLTRLVAYLIFGGVVGFLGEWALHQFFGSVVLKGLFFVFGIFLIFLGVLIALQKFKVSQKCPSLFQKFLGPRDAKNIVLFALIVSFSPCLPLVAMMGYIAMISDHWAKGVLYMTAFGLGTVVSPMIVAALLAGWISKVVRTQQKIFRLLQMVCGLILCALGVHLIFSQFRI
ncbi:MAG: sulfite exporter TauE/SafE family protein [Candidatus Omnitrophota bacterium]